MAGVTGMGAAARHREKLIGSAITLFRRQGYAATGLNEILALSGAPKGSLYHYFPKGKEELGAEAVRQAGAAVTAVLGQLRDSTTTAPQFIEAYCTLLGGWVEKSGYSEGCPIATTLLETVPQSERIAAAGRAAFDEWTAIIAAVHQRDGMAPEAARARAGLDLAAIEGALLLMRVQQSPAPLQNVARALSAL